MGLRRIPASAWLPDAISVGERERKLGLMARGGRDVADALAGFEGAQRTVVAAMVAELGLRPDFARCRPAAPASVSDMALWVPEDLCLLIPSSEGYRLVAASLCSPSFWRLQEKLGRPIQGVHAPVAGLNEAVGRYVTRFFERLPPGEVFQRRNWNIHRSFRRFHPDRDDWSAALSPADCGALCMRSEIQTLRKFPNGALLFTIRVERFPLEEIGAYPAAIIELLAAVSSMSPAERGASVFARHGETLIRYLEAQLAPC